jgi:hypothetical protein
MANRLLTVRELAEDFEKLVEAEEKRNNWEPGTLCKAFAALWNAMLTGEV